MICFPDPFWEKKFRVLPRWGRLTMVVGCARMVEPVFTEASARLNLEWNDILSIDYAIRIGEETCENFCIISKEDIVCRAAHAFNTAVKMAVSAEILGWARDDTILKGIAAAKSAAFAAAAIDAEFSGANKVVPIAREISSLRAALEVAQGTSRQNLIIDHLHSLKETCINRNWDDRTRVPLSSFGPLTNRPDGKIVKKRGAFFLEKNG